jgi:hypothetical protein
MRDYQIEIYPAALSPTIQSEWKKMSTYAENETRKNKPLVKSRVHEFWGGVHKSFVLSGNSSYIVKVDRNYAFNTIMSLVAIDRLLVRLLITIQLVFLGFTARLINQQFYLKNMLWKNQKLPPSFGDYLIRSGSS